MFEDFLRIYGPLWAINLKVCDFLWWMDSALQVIFVMLPRVYFVWRDLWHFLRFSKDLSKILGFETLGYRDGWLIAGCWFVCQMFAWFLLATTFAWACCLDLYIYMRLLWAFHVPFSEWNYKFFHSNGFRNIAIWEDCSMWGPLDSKVGL